MSQRCALLDFTPQDAGRSCRAECRLCGAAAVGELEAGVRSTSLRLRKVAREALSPQCRRPGRPHLEAVLAAGLGLYDAGGRRLVATPDGVYDDVIGGAPLPLFGPRLPLVLVGPKTPDRMAAHERVTAFGYECRVTATAPTAAAAS